MSENTLTGSQVLLKCLTELGVDLMIGYIGGAIMPTFDELPNYKQIRFITSRHEQGAAFIAQGYTRATGKIAPVLVTSGPGATNVITTVADSKMDSIPMLVITGQVATSVIGSDAFQESDIIGMMYACSNHAYMPLSSDEMAKSVAELFYVATHARTGPVCLDIPKDVQTQKTDQTEMPEKLDLPGFKLPPKPDISQVREAAKIINEAKKPVALVGHGIILSDSQKELLNFLEKSLIPGSMTLHGLSSIPASHPLSLHMMGMYGEVQSNRAIRDSDVLIALGMRFDDRVTGKLDEYSKGKKVVHIEIDPSEFNKNVKADAIIYSDLKEALPLLTNEIEAKTMQDRKSWFEQIENYRQDGEKFYQKIYTKGTGEKQGKLLMARIVHELSKFTKGQDNVVADVGSHQMFAAKFYKYEKFNSWFSSGGLGTMGFGLPAAIGVKLARPSEEVWCISGDGGFQMNIQELGTIMHEDNIKVNILIFNNSYLGMVKQWQDFMFDERYVQTKLTNPNFEYIAKGYDLPYKKVSKLEEIVPSFEWAKLQTKSPIIEFDCELKEPVLPMLLPGGSFHNFLENEQDVENKFSTIAS